MDYFHHLSLDLLYEIVIKLNGNGIVNLCQTNKNLFDKICNEKIKNNIYDRLLKYQYGFIGSEYLIPGMNFLTKKFEYLFDQKAPVISRDSIYFIISFIDTIHSWEGKEDIKSDFIFFDKETILNIMKNKEDDFGFKLIEKYIYSKYTIYHPFGLFSNKLGIDTNEDEKKYINDFFDSNIKKILFDFIITLFFNRFYIEDNVGNFRNFRNLSPDERIYIRSFLGNEDNIFGKLIQEEYFDSLLEKGEFTNLDDHIHVFLANNYI